jgi:hypothetical protein
VIFSIGFRFLGRHEPDASHPRCSHSVAVFLRLCVSSPRSLGAVTPPLIRVSSIQSAFRCMANADWKTFNCIKSFISPRAKRERTTGFASSSSSAKKRGRRSITSSSSSSFRPLKMMCVLFLSSLSVSLATREAFQLFLKRTRVGNILRPSVAFGAQTERRFIRNHREKKHLFFIRTLSSSSNFVAHYSLFLLTQYIRRPVRVDDAKT